MYYQIHCYLTTAFFLEDISDLMLVKYQLSSIILVGFVFATCGGEWLPVLIHFNGIEGSNVIVHIRSPCNSLVVVNSDIG